MIQPGSGGTGPPLWPPLRSPESGQSLAELLVALSVCIPLAVGGAALLRAFWDRTRCAWRVFEATRRFAETPRALSEAESMTLTGGTAMLLQRKPDRVAGSGRCGRAHEQVEIAELERWDGR